MAYLLLPTTRLVVRKTSCETMGPWRLPKTQSRRDQISHFRRVVAVSAKWLEVGQVSRRRVVAVSRRRVVAVPAKCLGVGQGISETGGCRLRRRVVTVSSRNEMWGKLPGSPARLCARFLALVSWCPVCVGGLGLWPSVPVLCVCVWSRRVLLALLRCLVSSTGFVSKRGDDPGHRPKDRVFRPWWSK